jgi:voltage-gated potassium channel
MATRPDTPAPPAARPSDWRTRLYTIIFEADTHAGKRFDQALIAAIVLSVGVVVLDSVDAIHQQHGAWLWVLEWFFTGLFTLEYALRLVCVPRPLVYARSFFGLIDLLAILPTYLALLAPGAHLLVDVRILRLLRIFRVLKLSTYIAEYNALGQALHNSRRKIMVFLSFVIMVVLILGTVMYVIEGPENGFTSIPTAMYWAVTTMTTVGFGDITPKTDFGRLISAVMMMLGWGVLAVPTGIVTAEMTATRRSNAPVTTRTCPICLTEGHRPEAHYCWRCGTVLPRYEHD